MGPRLLAFAAALVLFVVLADELVFCATAAADRTSSNASEDTCSFFIFLLRVMRFKRVRRAVGVALS
jgi:hypothetical protein